MNRYTSIFLALMCVSLGAHAHTPVFSKYHFGVGLGTGAHSSLFSLFIVKENEGRILSVKGITPDQFIRQATGMISSRANPDSIDFFEVHRVTSCVKIIDENGDERRPCDPFSDLWKLRFSEYPLKKSEPEPDNIGWSQFPSKPSDAQMAILNTYGIKTHSGMCYGENAFRLLRDIQDPLWIQSYQAAK